MPACICRSVGVVRECAARREGSHWETQDFRDWITGLFVVARLMSFNRREDGSKAEMSQLPERKRILTASPWAASAGNLDADPSSVPLIYTALLQEQLDGFKPSSRLHCGERQRHTEKKLDGFKPSSLRRLKAA
jgi:hypothetical protein